MKIPRRGRLQSIAARRTFRPARVLLLVTALACGVVAAGIVTESTAGGLCFGRTPTITGNNGDNLLRGTPRRDVIVGRGGDDVIKGRAGKDFICGNRDEDVINGGRGGDRIRGDRDIDYIAGNPGDDKMIGGGAGDELHGEIGRPSDRDIAKGRTGSDFIDVQDGVGNDQAFGGAGADTCNADGGDSQTNC